MKYYKMISGTNIVGIATQRDFVRFQQKHKILINCEISIAQFVSTGDKLYRDSWLYPLLGNENLIYDEVVISEISEEEYNVIAAAFEANKPVVEVEDKPEAEQPVEEQEDTDITLEFVKKSKLEEISRACNSIITEGFDIILSDEETHHFSLTTQDQLNLITLSTMIASGETSIPYHADGELCRFYSAEDMLAVITFATQFKTYQVSYHNALKLYVESLNDITAISNVYYGIEIPEQYLSDVLRVLNSQGGE